MAAGDGLIVMQPTSIAYSGTSASINADGGVDFTAATSLSLNGVFTSSFDNYLIVLYAKAGTGNPAIRWNLRVSGTDATGANYAQQWLGAYGATVAGARTTGATRWESNATATSPGEGDQVHLYGPGLAQPTAWRVVSANAQDNAQIADYAGTHSLSTSYDGLTIAPSSSSITGTIVVFGYEE